MSYGHIKSESRILIEVSLKPIQGNRFQPTGFPNLGHATYKLPKDGTDALLLESVQSMANRLEQVCLEDDTSKLVGVLDGMPFITVTQDNKTITNSILASHRASSAYILEGEDKSMENEIKKQLGLEKNTEVNLETMSKLHEFLFARDPNSLLHGIFFAKKELVGGRLKIPRALSAFIEATGVNEVVSGGAKIDTVNPGTDDTQNAKEGFGNVPFSRIEFTAKEITAYFNVDVSQITRYHISEDGKNMLICMALWKIRRFLESGLRLRTACDLIQVGDLKVTKPDGFSVPPIEELEKDLADLIKKCKFAPPMTIAYKKNAKSKKDK